MKVIDARNVNEAFATAVAMMRTGYDTRIRRPLGKAVTVEAKEPVTTVYHQPRERVLFDPLRDVNPFFHLMEALWIIRGRDDVRWLERFNGNIASYSDDGSVFHAPYGHRLRAHFGIDQLQGVITTLEEDENSRQAVAAIWSPADDLLAKSKDIPCNDLLMFKMNDGNLDLTVCCRSNDIVWGCYGTNVVQFSMIQEYVAAALGAPVGIYNQISDSFHYYPDTEVWKRLETRPAGSFESFDYYEQAKVVWVPLVNTRIGIWNDDLGNFLEATEVPGKEVSPTGFYPLEPIPLFKDPFFSRIAWPMYSAYALYKTKGFGPVAALDYLNMLKVDQKDLQIDWLFAARAWLSRRVKAIKVPA